jgi:uncharacterized protein
MKITCATLVSLFLIYMTTPAQSPQAANRAVVEEFFAALEAKDLIRFYAVWAEAGTQHMPFAPEGFPHLLEGKAAIRRQYGDLPKNYTSMRFPRTILATADPEVFFVEYRGEIVLAGSGKRYDNTYIGKFHVKAGKVIRFDEYFNPIVLQNAFGSELTKNFNTH